jgi:hypothetical protein
MNKNYENKSMCEKYNKLLKEKKEISAQCMQLRKALRDISRENLGKCCCSAEYAMKILREV